MFRYTLLLLFLLSLFEPVGMSIAIPFGIALGAGYYGLKENQNLTLLLVLAGGLLIDILTLSRWGLTSLLLLTTLVVLYMLLELAKEFSAIGLILLVGVSFGLRLLLLGHDLEIVPILLAAAAASFWVVVLNKVLTSQTIRVKSAL